MADYRWLTRIDSEGDYRWDHAIGGNDEPEVVEATLSATLPALQSDLGAALVEVREAHLDAVLPALLSDLSAEVVTPDPTEAVLDATLEPLTASFTAELIDVADAALDGDLQPLEASFTAVVIGVEEAVLSASLMELEASFYAEVVTPPGPIPEDMALGIWDADAGEWVEIKIRPTGHSRSWGDWTTGGRGADQTLAVPRTASRPLLAATTFETPPLARADALTLRAQLKTGGLRYIAGTVTGGVTTAGVVRSVALEQSESESYASVSFEFIEQ